jgi:hypothetical protein
MEQNTILKLDTAVTVQSWRLMSGRKELCGIFGCQNKPETKCPHCGNHYCEEHKWVISTAAHSFGR